MKGKDIDAVAALLFAAEEMRVLALKELCCACIASHLKGKDIETLKKEFDLADEDVDYTPATEKQMREDYKWIFDAADKKIKKIQETIAKREEEKKNQWRAMYLKVLNFG